MRILLVEDEVMWAESLARTLRQSDYEVEVLTDGLIADQRLTASDFDLCVLDLGLPGLDGGEILRRLRSRNQHTHVLVLSGRDAVEHRVRLLNMGADDYAVKPIPLCELEARVRALIRRRKRQAETEVFLGRLRLDILGKRAWLDGSPLDLGAREWAALAFLSRYPNQVVKKEQLIDALYTREEQVTPNAVEKFISRLRSKLEPAGLVIHTVRGLGYCLEKPRVPLSQAD